MTHPRRTVIAGLLWIAAGTALAQAPPQMQIHDPLAAARRISADEARKAVEKGEAVLVDVRAKESYDAEHAKGAVLIPVSEIAARANELPKDKLVITYCT